MILRASAVMECRYCVATHSVVALDCGLSVGEVATLLTITADGAFASPFGPTVRGGRMDTDLLVTRTIAPLRRPAEVLAGIVEGIPAGTDARLGIR